MALTETVEGGVELSLPHQSLGDTYIELISEVVKDLPGVTRLDLRDNRLTDVGVQEIVEAICSMDGHRGIQVCCHRRRPRRRPQSRSLFGPGGLLCGGSSTLVRMEIPGIPRVKEHPASWHISWFVPSRFEGICDLKQTICFALPCCLPSTRCPLSVFCGEYHHHPAKQYNDSHMRRKSNQKIPRKPPPQQQLVYGRQAGSTPQLSFPRRYWTSPRTSLTPCRRDRFAPSSRARRAASERFCWRRPTSTTMKPPSSWRCEDIVVPGVVHETAAVTYGARSPICCLLLSLFLSLSPSSPLKRHKRRRQQTVISPTSTNCYF